MITATNSRQSAADFLREFVPARLLLKAHPDAKAAIYTWDGGAEQLLQDVMDMGAAVEISGRDVIAIDPKPFDWNRPKVQS